MHDAWMDVCRITRAPDSATDPLDTVLGTAVAVQPAGDRQHLDTFAALLAATARQRLPLRRRAVATYRWGRRHPELRQRGNN